MEIRELHTLEDIRRRLDRIHSFQSENPYPEYEDIAAWFDYLNSIKSIQGNFNNDIGFVSTLLAKRYLEEEFNLQGFNAADKPQGAPGLDIDVKLPDGRHLVAEIKTTSPYKSNDLGAQQINTFRNDFKKLREANADIKIFFVTEPRTFELMKLDKYKTLLTGVHVVLLPSGEEFVA
ncbi:hypothetical protein JR338_06205 [Chloroflexota bacterium]|nr:hypothetical protein JR338_06205 [Chloroflexota bacterium]